ncbi:cyclopropane-fatty-acyl-phospholipid synthase family protein [Niveibacterium sp. 24ML]|uniref:SAM-dependent methyltransferase n=1 Tax=Niveibacterium sp. 24ML TaxID=2985512 RepID=UPI00226E0E88|nr:cyclopropane-fatty-acyl-phospholipid synthase family protein [Niveibacterium sp. 24ML]MCX9154907.1 cyclopropane-fatty-acyl-phospholipid synthase family protein [Niveibacterium sp. 24ML]
MSAIENTLASGRFELLPGPANAVIKMLGAIRGGSLELALPNGERVVAGEGHRVASFEVGDWGVFETLIAKGSIGLAEDFINGLWRTDNLTGLLTLAAQNRDAMSRAIHGNALRLLGYKIWHGLRANTRKGARRNIEAHYDLGNDFYSLWLDETMTYSSALFADPHQPLADAQRAKYRRILDQLDAKSGQRILEVGCGWGGFAEVATLEYGCEVLGLTLSPAQLKFARERAERVGFADKADFELCDYRDVRGHYDHIVSIEMYEAVGERFWPSYFQQLHDRLAPGGRIVIQAITIDDNLFGFYRKNPDFIQRYIFPGGMLASPGTIERLAKRSGLAIVDDLAFGLDYARTLAVWHERFNAVREQVHAQGFDERFVRLWQFYLSYCEAGFRAGSTDVHHYAFARA